MDTVKDIPHIGPHDLISGLIERFADYKGRLEGAVARGQGKPVSQVRIRPPLPKPYNIVAMAVNYMKQRVALARVLAFDPEVLLMDEPFGSLDAQTREAMQEELTSIWERTRKTIFFVTHDIDEAVYLGDRVVVLSARPARVRDEVRIALPRPRGIAVRKSIAFLECRNRIWDLIREEKPS